MVEVTKYSAEYENVWDAFVSTSRNGTFMLQRDYMEYHADRFKDHSLLFTKKGKIIALLPANVVDTEVQSHGGLSYGGIICGADMKAQLMLEVFEAMILYFRSLGFESINYKAIPHIYHQQPAEEDLYALFRNGARLYRRDLNTVISLAHTLPYSKLRKRKLKQPYSLALRQSKDFDQFMGLCQELLLQKYKLAPVHTAAEIRLLATRFPENIKLFTATQHERIFAGILVFETNTVAHCQYIATSAEGREADALDVLTDYLISKVYSHKVYFSFGVSTEAQGHYLNQALIRNKESYGGRGVVQDFYRITLTN